MPTYAAKRVLLAPVDHVWSFLAEPYHLADWWPGVSGVEPDRRGLAPGARWKVLGPNKPSLFRKPQATGMLLVLDVVPQRRIAFQLTGDRIDAEIELRPVEQDRTEVILAVEVPPLIGARRSFPHKALNRLFDLVQTAGEP
ncbi:MAG TPA: SRPBCC family protein [Gaiellaceae bacterium]|nr:SRPBCC family protein [Gaiellaceae bacterium]